MTTTAETSPAALASVAAGHSLELVDELWAARGGMTDAILDVGSDTERIVAAAGAVESLEWELDRAQTTLASAIELAASNGCSVEKIAASAGMAREDIVTLLWAARSARSQP